MIWWSMVVGSQGERSIYENLSLGAKDTRVGTQKTQDKSRCSMEQSLENESPKYLSERLLDFASKNLYDARLQE